MYMSRYMSYRMAIYPTATFQPFILPTEPKQRWRRERDPDEE